MKFDKDNRGTMDRPNGDDPWEETESSAESPAALGPAELLREELPGVMTRLTIPVLPGASATRDADQILHRTLVNGIDRFDRGETLRAFDTANSLLRDTAKTATKAADYDVLFGGAPAAGAVIATHLPGRETQRAAAAFLSNDARLRALPLLLLASPVYPIISQELWERSHAAQLSFGGELGKALIGPATLHFIGGWIEHCLAYTVNQTLERMLASASKEDIRISIHAEHCHASTSGRCAAALTNEFAPFVELSSPATLHDLPAPFAVALSKFVDNRNCVFTSAAPRTKGFTAMFQHCRSGRTIEIEFC